MKRIRFAALALVIGATFGCHTQSQQVKKEDPTPSAPETISFPALGAFEPGYAFSFEETVKTKEKIKKTGMQVESRDIESESRARWRSRISGKFLMVTELEIEGESSVRGRAGQGRWMETPSAEPREVCLTGIDPDRVVREFVSAGRRISAAHQGFVSIWNLAHRLEKSVAGQTLTSGKAVSLDPDLFEMLLHSALRVPKERFARGGQELAPSVKCAFNGVAGGVAVFQLELDRKGEAALGAMKESGRGSFGIDPGSGRLRYLDIDASFVFEENQFYEVLSVDRSGNARIVLGGEPPSADAKTYDLRGWPAAGDRLIGQRFASMPAESAAHEARPLPLVGYVEEYSAAGSELQARRRYLRCGDDDGKDRDLEAVAGLDGKTFVIGLGTPEVPKFERKEGDEKMFAWIGRDPLIYAWLPRQPVRIGESWSRADLPPSTEKGRATNHAVLVSVRSTPKPRAVVAVLDPNPAPWETAYPHPAQLRYIEVDPENRRIVSTYAYEGKEATVYAPAAAVNWKQLTANEIVVKRIKADLERARSLEKAGQSEAALEIYRKLRSRMTAKAALFEADLETLWTNFVEAGEGEAAQAIAQALYQLNRTEERFQRMLHSHFLARDWRALGHASEQFAKTYPKRPEGFLYQSIPKMNQRKFKDALKLLGEGTAILDANVSSGSPEIKYRLLYWAAKAHLELGDFQKAHELLEAALQMGPKGKEKQEMLDLMSHLMEAEKLKIYISFREPDVLSLGMYHLMSEKNGPLPPFIDLHIINGSDEDKVIVFSSEIVDVTYTSIDQVLVPGRKEKDGTVSAPFNMRVYQTPPLRKDFNVNSILEEIERPIRIVVKEKTEQGDKLLLERTIPVALWPRTRITIVRWDKESTGNVRSMEKALAAWVTPRSPFVEAFIRDAKKMLPEGVEFLGGAGIDHFTARDQVRAMYESLKSRGTSYVGYTSGTDKNCFYQDIRLPAHVYRTSNSLCVEGTVLFASLMEGMGLEPIIVLRPGHAFVGWRDPNGPIECKFGRFFVLETTSVGRHDFATALKFAETDFEHWRAWLENPTGWDCRILDITQLRREGYKPQPYPEE